MLKAEKKRQETSRTVFPVALAGCGLLQSKKYLDKLMINQRKKKAFNNSIIWFEPQSLVPITKNDCIIILVDWRNHLLSYSLIIE